MPPVVVDTVMSGVTSEQSSDLGFSPGKNYATGPHLRRNFEKKTGERDSNNTCFRIFVGSSDYSRFHYCSIFILQKYKMVYIYVCKLFVSIQNYFHTKFLVL